MDNDNLTPADYIGRAKKEVERKEITKIQQCPNLDYFPISAQHLAQRLYTDPDRVAKFLTQYNEAHPDSPIQLLANDMGITGTGDTDRAIMTIANILNKINIAQGEPFGQGVTKKVINYALELGEGNEYNLTPTMQDKIMISFSLSDFAQIYYGKKGYISGGEIRRVLDVLHKLDAAYYLLYNPKSDKVTLKKYISLPQIDFDGRAKNINLTLEIDPSIFRIIKGEKYAIVSVKYFNAFKNANHFHNQFFTILLDIIRLNNSKKRSGKIAQVTITRRRIFEQCATIPKYKKNPQYKEKELQEAINYAMQVGAIIAYEDTETAAGESAVNLTLNLRYYLPNQEEIKAGE